MGIKRYHDSLLAQLSDGLSSTAGDLNRQELERLGRRAEAARQCRQILDSLKERIARRAALRGGPSLMIAEKTIPSQAA